MVGVVVSGRCRFRRQRPVGVGPSPVPGSRPLRVHSPGEAGAPSVTRWPTSFPTPRLRSGWPERTLLQLGSLRPSIAPPLGWIRSSSLTTTQLSLCDCGLFPPMVKSSWPTAC